MSGESCEEFYQACELLVKRQIPPLIFQQRVEESFYGAKSSAVPHYECPKSYKIKLRGAPHKNNSLRGLKVRCDNARKILLLRKKVNWFLALNQ